ncbi:MAG TPA: hypothetical protein VG758_16540 [Hyphomicrobiaceae bacterium]|jgi:hypothetical protein|nr:hypothetical protein [Hyphomicrobiaceae bacterium]
MTCRSFLIMPAMVLALGVGSAFAAPTGVKDVGGTDSLVVKVHGCHRSCELGPAGWHRHVGPYCARVACVPRAWHPHRCFVDRWGVRRCRW